MQKSSHSSEEGKDGSSYTLFNAIENSSLPPEEKTISRLANEAFVVIVAGGETTARSLAFALYHINANPEVLQHLLNELTIAMPRSSDQPSIKTLQQLPYLVC